MNLHTPDTAWRYTIVAAMLFNLAHGCLSLAPEPLSHLTLIINECRVGASTSPQNLYDSTDWVELYNPGYQAINLADFSLSDNAASPSGFVFEDTLLEPGGYYVVLCTERNDTMRNVSGFSFSTDKQEQEAIALFRRSGEPIDIIDIAQLIEQTGDKHRSMGRAIDGSTRWIAQDSPSPGGANHGQ